MSGRGLRRSPSLPPAAAPHLGKKVPGESRAGAGNADHVRWTGYQHGGTAVRRSLPRRVAAALGADGNPLRRGIDRAEAAARLALAVGFLVAAPLLAPFAGHLTQVTGERVVRQQSSWREVGAVLLRAAPQEAYGYGAMSAYWVPARWRAPDGAVRTGQVPARGGLSVGAVVPIWVDRAGRATGRPPMTVGLVRVRTAFAEFLTVAALAALALLSAGLLRVLLDRRRMAQWGLEWACFGPRWTARRRPGG